MANGQYDRSAESHNYLVTPEVTPGLYDGTSCESTASSPMNSHVSCGLRTHDDL